MLVTAMPYAAYAEETAATLNSDADTQQSPDKTDASGSMSACASNDTAVQDGTSSDETATKDDSVATDAVEDDKPFLYAKDSLTFNERVRVNGNFDIILHDDISLNFKKGITVENGSSLTIWVRDKGTGKVTATSDSGSLAAISVNEGSTLQLLGGTIEAKTKTNDAAGIGGDEGKNAGVIVIAAGTVTATSDMNADGIGGCDGGSAVDEISIATGGKAEKPKDPVKEGYIFEGWYLVTGDSMADEPYDFNTPVYGDIILKARWKKAEDQVPADNGNSTPTGIPSANRSGAAASANVTNVKGGSTAVTKATSVKTGDTSQMPAFIAMAAAGAAGIAGAFVARRRKKD